MPSAYQYNESLIENFNREWPAIVKQHYNHPSIMSWVIFNESWGVMDIHDHPGQQALSLSLYHLTKSLDDTRFVIANDGWEHTKSDLITLHNYKETKEGLQNTYQNQNETILQGKKAAEQPPKRVFAAGFNYQNEPVILSEFAGIAFTKDTNNGWGYGEGVTDEKAFLDKLSQQMHAIKETHDFSGYCITQLTDVQQEVNGLLSETRQPKVSLESIKQLNDMFQN